MVLTEDVLSEETFVVMDGKIFPTDPNSFCDWNIDLRHNSYIVAKLIPQQGSDRQEYMKGSSLSRLAGGGNGPSMVLHDLLA